MPTTLDWNASDPNSWSNYPVMLATMRGLTSLRPNNGVGSALATSWERELTEDGHERYRFFLRTDVVWSDGKTPLVAEDFVVGWRRAVQGKERGEMSDILGAKEVLDLQDQGASQEKVDEAVKRFAVTAIDEHTFEVTLAQPRSYFLSRMANVYIFFPAPSAELKGKSPEEIRDYFDRPRDGRPLVLGPFRLDSWDSAGERVRLLRNPHTVFAPPLGSGEKYAEVVTLMKSEIGPALYDRGRVDFVFVDSPVALRAAPSELQRRPLLSTYLLALNTQRPPLDRREVRDAIAHALDRDALLKGLLPTARVSNTFLPPELPGASTPEQARALPHYEPTRKPLEGVRPLRLVYRSDESFIPEVAIAERIKVQLSKIGLNVILEPRSDFSSEVARLAPDGYRAHDLYLRRIGA
ncbi:MAG: ABC transporter substrate-binding protein, partial [Myxococcaceae bacterium]